MATTIVGLYDDDTTARRVVSELEAVGFGEPHMRLACHDGEPTSYDITPGTDTTPDRLEAFGIEGEEARFYAEGVRRGGSLVITRANDADVERAVDIMGRHNPVRFEDRKDAYQYDASAPMYTAAERDENRARYAEQATERLREIEENLKVGKREFVSGGVVVRKVVDTDVAEETLQLREEQVEVDRTAVNRTLTPAEADAAFEEKTVEVVARSEEAVVEKEAVVTGEVAVGKDVNVRQETVSDTVRSTRVVVEEIDADRFASAEPVFREHYAATYTSAGRDFDTYKPAYQYGYAAAGTYEGRDFADVEADLRSDYATRYHDGDESLWDEFKDAVRHGWNEATAAVDAAV